MYAVEMRDITKRFGAAAANDAVSFHVRPQEIHALVGENGAGKSTLMNILYGLHTPDAGEILINGEPAALRKPSDAIALGIGMVHQHFMLIPPFTVTENIILGEEPVRRLNMLEIHRAEQEIAEISRKYRIDVVLQSKIRDLSVGLQQRVEILKVLYRHAAILIFDEPTPVLTPAEVEEFFASLRELRAHGKTIILITHKLSEVVAISDRVTVMRHGKVVGELETALTNSDELARLMVGKELAPQEGKISLAASEEPVLSLESVSALNDRKLPALADVSLAVRSGEILGIAGVEGNGQSELVQLVTGLREPVAGTVLIGGQPVRGRSQSPPVAYIPDDRLKLGLVGDFSVTENLVLGRQKEFSGSFLMERGRILDFARRMIAEFDIRPPRRDISARGLSGGNQQKVVAARELSKDTRLVVAHQPTRGLDIGAINFVHSSIIAERNKGKAILLVSSDLSELLGLADRIAVMFGGRIVATLRASDTTEQELGLYMTGAMKRSA